MLWGRIQSADGFFHSDAICTHRFDKIVECRNNSLLVLMGIDTPLLAKDATVLELVRSDVSRIETDPDTKSVLQ